MSKRFNYGRLRQLLLDLGFTDRTVEDSHTMFRHNDTDTILLFTLHKSGDAVRPTERVKVRRMLDERGLLAGEEFDRMTGIVNGRRPAAQSPGVG